MSIYKMFLWLGCNSLVGHILDCTLLPISQEKGFLPPLHMQFTLQRSVSFTGKFWSNFKL